MDNTNSTPSKQNKLYNLLGTAAVVNDRVSRTGTPYFYIRFATRIADKPQTVTAMAFGKSHEAIKEHLSEGSEIRLNGYFAEGSEGGRTFTVTALGAEPKQVAA
jgi:hypothetical protein